jgi:sporulation protein YlmC with PRC-barrel domain
MVNNILKLDIKGDTSDDLKLRQLRDQIKTEYCKNKNIKLLRIPYTKIKYINSILIKELKK